MKILKISLILYLFLAILTSCNTVHRTACPTFNGKGDMRGFKHATNTKWNLDIKHVNAFKNKRHLNSKLSDLTPISEKNQIITFEKIPDLPKPDLQENKYNGPRSEEPANDLSVSAGGDTSDYKIGKKDLLKELAKKLLTNKSIKNKENKGLVEDEPFDGPNTKALLSLVFSVLGLILFAVSFTLNSTLPYLIFPLGFLFSVIAVVLSNMAIKEMKGSKKGKIMAWAGLIIGVAGILAVILTIILIVFLIALFLWEWLG